MKKLLIHGWRGINHSYAMVNQHQILALSNLGGFEIFHHDMAFRLQHWNATDNSAGFSVKDSQFIASLPDLPSEQADAIYRIGAPIHAPSTSNAITPT